MKIIKQLTNYNHNKGDISRIKYIVIHYTGNSGASASANCRYYASGNVGASAHYFVDFDGAVFQSVEDADIAWHCGAKTYYHPECRNSNSIGIEMCCKSKGSKEAGSKDWYFEDATVNATIELTKELMQKYNIAPDHVIRHYDVTHKLCPTPYTNNNTKHTWEAFKGAVGASVDGWVETNGQWRFYRSGHHLTNWHVIDHYWYYFDENGIMLTGWVQLHDKWFYLQDEGSFLGALWKSDDEGAQYRWYVD